MFPLEDFSYIKMLLNKTKSFKLDEEVLSLSLSLVLTHTRCTHRKCFFFKDEFTVKPQNEVKLKKYTE